MNTYKYDIDLNQNDFPYLNVIDGENFSLGLKPIVDGKPKEADVVVLDDGMSQLSSTEIDNGYSMFCFDGFAGSKELKVKYIKSESLHFEMQATITTPDSITTLEPEFDVPSGVTIDNNKKCKCTQNDELPWSKCDMIIFQFDDGTDRYRVNCAGGFKGYITHYHNNVSQGYVDSFVTTENMTLTILVRAVTERSPYSGRLFFSSNDGFSAQSKMIVSVHKSSATPYDRTLGIATATKLGGVKVGSGLAISEDGTLSATGGGTSDSGNKTYALGSIIYIEDETYRIDPDNYPDQYELDIEKLIADNTPSGTTFKSGDWVVVKVNDSREDRSIEICQSNEWSTFNTYFEIVKANNFDAPASVFTAVRAMNGWQVLSVIKNLYT